MGRIGNKTKTPTSFRAVRSASEGLSHVLVLDCAWDATKTLERHSKHKVWAKRTWVILSELNHYGQQRSDGMEGIGNFRRWLEASDRPALNPVQVNLDESVAVRNNKRFSQSRLINIPASVDPSGVGWFGAHVRVDAGGSAPAPRLHFLDQTAESGLVVVGYIGPHLDNLQSKRQ